MILAGRNDFLRVSLSIRSRSSDAVVWMVVNGAFFEGTTLTVEDDL